MVVVTHAFLCTMFKQYYCSCSWKGTPKISNNVRACVCVRAFMLYALKSRVSMHCLSEYSGVVLSSFSPSRSTAFTDASLLKPEDSFSHCSRQLFIQCHGSGKL